MNKQFLKECLLVEVIGGKNKKFSWLRVLRHAWRQPHRRYLLWFRLLSYLYTNSGAFGKKIANHYQRKLIKNYHTDISLLAKIKPGLHISHYCAIVITSHCTIGENFRIRQNMTIGIKTQGLADTEYNISIGDNVYVGANCCIIGDNINIGDNVTIGAMSFVNKDIPENSKFYQKRESVIEQQ
ncbi:serine acetyltransferase [Pseudocitrobacter corydidari]